MKAKSTLAPLERVSARNRGLRDTPAERPRVLLEYYGERYAEPGVQCGALKNKSHRRDVDTPALCDISRPRGRNELWRSASAVDACVSDANPTAFIRNCFARCVNSWTRFGENLRRMRIVYLGFNARPSYRYLSELV